MKSNLDLFADQTKKRSRGRPARTPLLVNPEIAREIRRIAWRPTGESCRGEGGAVLDSLAGAVLRQNPAAGIVHEPAPADPEQIDCTDAVRWMVNLLRLIGLGAPGTTHGDDLDRKFKNACAYLQRETAKARKRATKGR